MQVNPEDVEATLVVADDDVEEAETAKAAMHALFSRATCVLPQRQANVPASLIACPSALLLLPYRTSDAKLDLVPILREPLLRSAAAAVFPPPAGATSTPVVVVPVGRALCTLRTAC